MRWMVVGLVVAMGCAAGAEMRPRGRRNAVRIDALEKRITVNTQLEQKVQKLEERVRAMQVQIDRLSQQPVTAAPPSPPPSR